MPPATALARALDILVLSAHLPELSGLAPLLGQELKTRVRGLQIMATPVGIGLPAAAGGTTARLCSERPRAAVFVGTCGAYEESGLAVGDVVVVRRAHLACPAAVERRGE